MTTSVPTRSQPIELTVWYPTASVGQPELIGENKIFKGVSALRNAPVADGHYPVIVMAHGGFRAAPFHAGWVASNLASRGYIVGVARPPALGPRDAQAAVQEIWLRPADLSATLTAVEGDPELSVRIKSNSAAVVGFFLGGTSALALAGGRLDAQNYMRSCDDPEAGIDCAWFAKNGVDLKKADVSQLTRSHHDQRIKAVVAIDPELSKSFAPESLTKIKIPVAIINLGRPDERVPALDASSLGKAIPDTHYDIVPDAVSYSAFSECTPKGPALLREEDGDDTICRDGGSRSREEIHGEIAGKVEAALNRGLSAKP
ncbi:alpha/beta hydrolase family protein [Microvirga solisilvae]|uniref:alpha/beta hydrolase family protein n=1 Tax=Microvirga solisilvae TaxID=2919498 RepID=UPI001FAFDE76|nr:hypothetical protein [Microvirga solisilvae]